MVWPGHSSWERLVGVSNKWRETENLGKKPLEEGATAHVSCWHGWELAGQHWELGESLLAAYSHCPVPSRYCRQLLRGLTV